ncbi:NB-ARC domain-containing protein [Streptomyces sp. DW26H14]
MALQADTVGVVNNYFGTRAVVPVPPRPESYGGELPIDAPVFINRYAQMSRLRSWAGVPSAPGHFRPGVAVVSGMCGIGKSALLVRFGHEVEKAGSHRALYVDLSQWRSAASGVLDRSSLLGHVLHALGVSRDWPLPTAYAELHGLYLRKTRTTRMLLTVDNVMSRDEVEALLPGSAGSVVVVACARPLPTLEMGPRALALPLDRLTREHSMAVLKDMVRGAEREEPGPGVLEDFARLCGGIPSALHLAGKLLRTHPGHRDERLVRDLTARLKEEGPMRDSLADEIYARLTPLAQRLYRLLPYHPGYDIGPEAATALLGAGPDDTEDALEDLAEAELVPLSPRTRPGGPRRWRLPDVRREHALRRGSRQGEEGEAERTEALGRLLLWYRRQAERADRAIDGERLREAAPLAAPVHGADLAFTGEADARRWFEAETAALHGMVAAAESLGGTAHEHGAALCEPLWKYYEDNGNNGNNGGNGDHDQAAHVFGMGLAMAQSAGLVRLAVRLRCQLSQPLWQLGRHAEARRETEQAVRSAVSVARGTTLHASALEFHGKALEAAGDHTGAVGEYRAARAIHEGLPNPYGVALQVFLAGRALRRAGRADEAAAQLAEALPLARTAGKRRLVARAARELADLRVAAGRVPDAIALYEEALGHEEVRDALSAQVALHETLAALGREPAFHHARAAEVRERAGVPAAEEPA